MITLQLTPEQAETVTTSLWGLLNIWKDNAPKKGEETELYKTWFEIDTQVQKQFGEMD